MPSIQHNVSLPARQAPLAPNPLLPLPPFAPSNEFESDSHAYMADGDEDFVSLARHSHEQLTPTPTPRVRMTPIPARLNRFGSLVQRSRAPLLSRQPYSQGATSPTRLPRLPIPSRAAPYSTESPSRGSPDFLPDRPPMSNQLTLPTRHSHLPLSSRVAELYSRAR